MSVKTVRTTERRLALLVAAEGGATNRDAAAIVGISESSLYKWLQEDAEFGDEYRRTQALGRFQSIDIIANSKDWKAHAWLLARVDPEHWAEQKVTPESLSKKLDAYLQGVSDGREEAAHGDGIAQRALPSAEPSTES